MINRVAVVTGANKGIGFHISHQLASSGTFSHIILGCRDATRGQAAVKKIQDLLDEPSKSNTEVSFLPLTVGDDQSHEEFRKKFEETHDKLDVLVNNAGILNFDSNPTHTLDVNYRGTVHLTQTLFPLLRKGSDARLVNVASQLGHLHQISSRELANELSSSTLTLSELDDLVKRYETSVKSGTHVSEGWGRMSYGMSKLFLIAATRIMAREEDKNKTGVKVNSACPGRCSTDLTGKMIGMLSRAVGGRSASDGAETITTLTLLPNEECPTGAFYRVSQFVEW